MAHRDTLLITALAFTLSACAARPDPEPIPAVSAVVAIPAAEQPAATPEFHGARIGRDTLRSRLQSEN